MMEERRKKIILIVGLALVMIVGSFYSFWQKNSVSEHVTTGEVMKGAKGNEEKSNEIVIYISGAVNKPGVFKLAQNARVIDAVTLAGGLTPEADVTKTNMAQLVKDGMHINVVAKAPVSQSNGTSTPPVSIGKGQGMININSADKTALDTLPGVGPALAERIVEYRQTNGGFSDIEGLKKVPGVSSSKFEKMKDKITI